MTIQQMKDAIARVYRTESWQKKVDGMYDNQVIAIYYDFLNRGILDKVLRKEKPKEKHEPVEQYQQMSIFDLINSQ